MASPEEYAVSQEAEKLAGRALAEIAAEALERASFIGLPIDFSVTSNRGVAVHFRGKRAFFRVVAVANPSRGYTVCLRRYLSDCGEIGVVRAPGEVQIHVTSIPTYLSSPGELYNGFVADVWNRRFLSVLNGKMEKISFEEIPSKHGQILLREVENMGVSSIIRYYFSPDTLDYAFGILELNLLPVWLNSLSESLSVSEKAAMKLREFLRSKAH
ncbi:hypothetical protein [Infirmifilum sp.]|uniref:hypothetical protein n=1 Tax=Infirmifilum sp. TaxID=2856575 RepID=UPI003D0CA38F